MPAKSADSKNTPRHKMHNAYTSIIIMQTSQSPVSPRTTGSNNNKKRKKQAQCVIARTACNMIPKSRPLATSST